VANFDDLLTLITHTYTAAASPEHWPIALELLAESVHSRSTTLLSHDFESHAGGCSVAVRMDPDIMQGYNAHYHALDPYASRGLSGFHDAGFRVGRVGVGEQFMAPDVLRRTPYYNEFQRGRDIFWMMGLPLVQVGKTVAAFLSTMRQESEPPFGRAETRLLGMLAPHLVRAVQIQRRLRGAHMRAAALEDVLDQLDAGIVLLSNNGHVVFVNRAAQKIVAARNGLWIDRGSLATVASHMTMLREAIRQASDTSRGDGLSHGCALKIPRAGGRSLDVLVSLLILPEQRNLVPHRSVAVFVRDPSQHVEALADLLRRTYGLTSAESRIAIELGAGKSVAQAADACKVSQGTARWHVKHVFAKTDTRTQSQLARRLVIAKDLPILRTTR